MSAPQQLQCREVAGLLVFYACGETSEQENALIETHLAACAASVPRSLPRSAGCTNP